MPPMQVQLKGSILLKGVRRLAAALTEMLSTFASLACRYSADKTGQYELAVKSSLDGEPLAGSPFSLIVMPGALSPSHCTAELAHGGSCLSAGAEVAVSMHAKDQYGNTVSPDLIS